MLRTTLLALALAAVSAPMALAKAHDQGMAKGSTVKTVTVPNAQALGGILGAAHGFNNLR